MLFRSVEADQVDDQVDGRGHLVADVRRGELDVRVPAVTDGAPDVTDGRGETVR